MLANIEDRKITNGDIDRMIAVIDKGWRELNSIHMSCQEIRKDLVRISQVLNEKFGLTY
jgi:hypothetical protein